MTPREKLAAWAEDQQVEILFLDPPETFDAAILGIVHGAGQEPAVLYDEALVLAGLQAQGMDEEDALEWFCFNTVGAFMGPATPRFLGVDLTRESRT